MIAIKCVFVIIITIISAIQIYGQNNIIITEASGITRLENKFLIVSDDAPGRYYEYNIPDYDYNIIPIDPMKVREVLLPGAGLAGDLEAIGILADGRVVVLSELMHSLIGKPGIDSNQYSMIAYYNKSYTEFGNRGLEGLAIKSDDNNNSKLAVLWEGGYPVNTIVPDELYEYSSHNALKPRVIIHKIENNDIAGYVYKDSHKFTLDVPIPDNIKSGQRYRGSALVWYQIANAGQLQECLIVLLQSENSPDANSSIRTSYKHKILQRFNLDGNPLGEPININDYAKAAFEKLDDFFYSSIGAEMSAHIKEIKASLEKGNWENVNWEGMSWFIKNESLVLIYDKNPKDPPFALILEIPDSWR